MNNPELVVDFTNIPAERQKALVLKELEYLGRMWSRQHREFHGGSYSPTMDLQKLDTSTARIVCAALSSVWSTWHVLAQTVQWSDAEEINMENVWRAFYERLEIKTLQTKAGFDEMKLRRLFFQHAQRVGIGHEDAEQEAYLVEDFAKAWIIETGMCFGGVQKTGTMFKEFQNDAEVQKRLSNFSDVEGRAEYFSWLKGTFDASCGTIRHYLEAKQQVDGTGLEGGIRSIYRLLITPES